MQAAKHKSDDNRACSLNIHPVQASGAVIVYQAHLGSRERSSWVGD